MPGEGFAERFKRLEIPEEKKRGDLGFVDTPFEVPAPLPLEAHALLVLAGGRALVPVEEAAAPDGPRVLLYDRWHAVREVDSPSAAEKGFLATHEGALAREAKRFLGAVPAAVLGDRDRIAAAIERLADGAEGESILGPLVGDARLLRLHGKLYDLRTLREYGRVFEKAIEPGLFRDLQAFPDTAAPEDVLARIERSLDQVHAKARSPLRNKMATSRVVLDGVTLLPIYREEAKGLFDEYRRRLERFLKRRALARLA